MDSCTMRDESENFQRSTCKITSRQTSAPFGCPGDLAFGGALEEERNKVVKMKQKDLIRCSKINTQEHQMIGRHPLLPREIEPSFRTSSDSESPTKKTTTKQVERVETALKP